jgi:hypothetical protein
MDTSVQDLIDIEAIKQLKARYCLALDLKRWDEWRACFTDDMVIEGVPFARDLGPDAFVKGVSERLAPLTTVHQVHNGAVTITGPGTARAFWAMYDDLQGFEEPEDAEYPRRQGFGYYEEQYRKGADGWRISFFRFTRLRVDRLRQDSKRVESAIRPVGAQWLDPKRTPI